MSSVIEKMKYVNPHEGTSLSHWNMTSAQTKVSSKVWKRDFTTRSMLALSVFPAVKLMWKLVIYTWQAHHHRMFSGSGLLIFQPIWTKVPYSPLRSMYS